MQISRFYNKDELQVAILAVCLQTQESEAWQSLFLLYHGRTSMEKMPTRPELSSVFQNLLFFKLWIKLNGLGSILASSYVLSPGKRNDLFINLKNVFFSLPKASMHVFKREGSLHLNRGEKKKIAYLSFRVSVSVFVLVSECKFQWIVFLYFFICHFFTYSL